MRCNRVFFWEILGKKGGQQKNRINYYPFGLTFNSYQRAASTAQKFLNQGKELQEELGTYDFHARMYDPILARTFQIDPLAEAYYSLSSYSWVANNPLKFIDPTGMFLHDYTIYSDGGIVKQETDDSSDSFTYVDSDGNSHDVGTYEKNENGLIQLNDIDDSEGSGAKVSTKPGNGHRLYTSGDAVASLIGASADSGEEIYVVSVSESDGSSPSPSTSHVDGKNMDIRYAQNNGGRGALDYQNSVTEFNKIDQTASASMNSSLKKFGYKNIKSSTLTTTNTETVAGKSVTTTSSYSVSGTSHLSNHYNHEHLQGYNPTIQNRPMISINRLSPITTIR